MYAYIVIVMYVKVKTFLSDARYEATSIVRHIFYQGTTRFTATSMSALAVATAGFLVCAFGLSSMQRGESSPAAVRGHVDS